MGGWLLNKKMREISSIKAITSKDHRAYINSAMRKKKERIIKRCSCKKKYSLEAWKALKYIGEMTGIDGEIAELRDCSCGSTMLFIIS